MAIRVSGLISGLDTDSIVQELVSAYSTKKEKYEKAQTKQEWKMDAWKTMNSKIYGFYTSSLSGMRMSNAYNIKNSTVSNSSVAKVTASSAAVNGTQSLKVKSLAASGYMTGGVVKQTDGSKVQGDTALGKLGIYSGSKIAVNDETITITSDMTVNQLVGKLKDEGVNASFDESNQRFFVSARKSGAEGEFTITADNVDGLGALQSLGLFAVKDTEKNDTAEMKKYEKLAASGTAEQKAVALKIINAFSSSGAAGQASDSDREIISKYDAQTEILANWKTVQDYNEQQNIVNTHKDNLDTYRQTLVKEQKEVENDKGEKETVDVLYTDAEIEELKESNPDKYNDIIEAKSNLDEFNKADAYVSSKENKDAKDAAEAALAKAMKEADPDGSVYNDTSDFITAVEGYVNDPDKIKAYNNAKLAVNIAEITSSTSDVARITGKDSEIELNGARFTSSTGTFSINGLSITAMQVTGDQAVSINTSNDTQGIYDKIKSFIGKYNELIKDIDTAYNAASAGDYEPLTDDEKEEMTDDQIEKWETKIKDALLRRDSTLGNVSSAMKSIMNSSFEINGKTYSLDTFGISTQGYFSSDVNERGMLHIDGDADDSASSGKTDRLMAAINEDPEAVASFFQKLSSKLYDDLTKKMASSSVSSVYTIYNDKQMSSEYSDYKEKIDKWKEKLEYYEEFYYKKFSAMESALSKLQSSTSNLTSLFGA